MYLLLRAVLFSMCINPWLWAAAPGKSDVDVDLFLSSTCSHCQKEDAFFKSIAPQNPWLKIHTHFIDTDKQALLQFNQVLDQLNQYDFAVPSAVFCNSRWVGFAFAKTTGSDLLKALQYCHQQIQKSGSLTPAAKAVLQKWSKANSVDLDLQIASSPAVYLVLLSAIDAFNPCALFSFMSFFAFIFILKNKKERVLAGCLFLLAIGLVHCLQEYYPQGFYALFPWLRIVAALAGFISLYLLWRLYKQQPVDSAFVFVALVIGFLVQSFQQNCSMNWSLIYEHWLHSQHIGNSQVLLFRTLYQFLYLLPLALFWLAYTLLMKFERFAKFSGRLQIIGQLILLVVAILLIISPEQFAQFSISIVVGLGALIYFVALGYRSKSN